MLICATSWAGYSKNKNYVIQDVCKDNWVAPDTSLIHSFNTRVTHNTTFLSIEMIFPYVWVL